MLEFRVCVCVEHWQRGACLLAARAYMKSEKAKHYLRRKTAGRTGKTFVFKIKLCRGGREGGKLAWDREGERGVGWV